MITRLRIDALTLTVLLAIALLITGCSVAPPAKDSAPPPISGSITFATPVTDAPVTQTQPVKLDILLNDLSSASAKAKADATMQKDPALQKMANDRALCFDTLAAYAPKIFMADLSLPSVSGLFSLSENAIELEERLAAQTASGLIPNEIRANCASYAGQKVRAVVDIFARLRALAGLR